MKTAEDFKEQAALKGITKWHSHNCSFCRYPVGYLFKSGEVFYDCGCDCIRGGGENLEPRTWNDVAERYNMQSHPDVIKKMNEYWGFAN